MDFLSLFSPLKFYDVIFLLFCVQITHDVYFFVLFFDYYTS